MVQLLNIFRSIFFLIGFILDCTLLFAIIFRTPNTMKNIRIYLFMITFTEALITVCFEILIIPEGAAGLPGITVNGLLKHFGNLGGIVTATAASSMFSVPCLCVLLCSIIRLLSVSGVKLEKYTPLFVFPLLMVILGPILLIPIAYSFFFLNKEQVIHLAKERNLTEILDDLLNDRRPYMIFDTASRLLVPAGGLFMLACATGAAVTAFVNIATQARSQRLMSTSNISASRHDLQRRIMLTLLAQIGLPIVAGIFAFILCIPIIHDYFLYNTFDISPAVSFMYYLFAAYTIISSSITLTIIRPYRTFVLNLFRKKAARNFTLVSKISKASK